MIARVELVEVDDGVRELDGVPRSDQLGGPWSWSIAL